MKIGILTRRAGYNYGSSLQAFAMSCFIKSMGYDCTIINYNEYAGNFIWRIRPTIENIEWFILKNTSSFTQYICRKRYDYLQIRDIQRCKFKQFEERYLPLSDVQYYSYKQLREASLKFDALICGSDQIWSPYLFDPVFYFGFLKETDRKKTIAYAPSMGVNSLDDISKKQRQLINNVQFISCREQAGAELLRQITKRNVPMVLDPTLMVSVDNWQKIKAKGHPCDGKDYILAYYLHTNEYEDNIPCNYIKKLKIETGLPVFNIQIYRLSVAYKGDFNINNAGPQEFLSLISNAKYICTNSFHCCVFSFIFKKRFFVTERFRISGNATENQNFRIRSLLELIECPDSLIDDSSKLMALYLEPDYTKGIEKLRILQKESYDYILKALS